MVVARYRIAKYVNIDIGKDKDLWEVVEEGLENHESRCFVASPRKSDSLDGVGSRTFTRFCLNALQSGIHIKQVAYASYAAMCD